MIRFAFLLGLTLSALALSAAPTAAQDGRYGQIASTQATAPGYFFFAQPGQATITVIAGGNFAYSGRYELGVGTDVADLFGLAGGPKTILTGSTLRLVRNGAVTFEVPVRELAQADAPTLRDGDTVEVLSLDTSVPGFFVHATPEVDPIRVTAAGGFSAPGLYLVSPGSTLSDLLAMAGGVRNGGDREDRVEVTTTVRVFRSTGLAYESAIHDLYASAQPFVLQPDDTVELDIVRRVRNTFTWRDGVSIATAAATVSLAIYQITR